MGIMIDPGLLVMFPLNTVKTATFSQLCVTFLINVSYKAAKYCQLQDDLNVWKKKRNSQHLSDRKFEFKMSHSLSNVVPISVTLSTSPQRPEISLKTPIKPPFRLKTFITNFDKSLLISFCLVICVNPVNETTFSYLKMLSPPFLLQINYRASLISYPQRGIISSGQSHKWNTHHGEVLSTFWGNKKVMTIFIGHCIIGKRGARNAGDLSLCESLVNFN